MHIFSLNAGVWLKHAGCLQQLGNHEDAATSYFAILSSPPQHTEAKLKLYSYSWDLLCVYIALGCSNDALYVVTLDQGNAT